MVGPALDDDVALPAERFLVVEDEDDLAFEHDAVIDRLRPVHVCMARARAAVRGGIARADLGEVPARLFRRDAVEPVAVGRDIENPDARPSRRRDEPHAVLWRFTRRPVDPCGRFARVPYLEEQRAVLAADPHHARHRPVLLEDGPALLVVPGYYPPDRLRIAHCVRPPSVSANQSAI